MPDDGCSCAAEATAFRITVTKRCVRMVCLTLMYVRISLYFCVQEIQCHAIFSCQTTPSYQLLLMSGTDLVL